MQNERRFKQFSNAVLHDASTLQIVQERVHNVNLVNGLVQEKCSQVEAVICGQLGTAQKLTRFKYFGRRERQGCFPLENLDRPLKHEQKRVL